MAQLTAFLVYSNIHAGMRPGGRQTLVQVYHVQQPGYVPGTNDIEDVWTATNLPQPKDTLEITAAAPAGPRTYVYVLDRQARSLDPVGAWEITVTYCESPKNIPAQVN